MTQVYFFAGSHFPFAHES